MIKQDREGTNPQDLDLSGALLDSLDSCSQVGGVYSMGRGLTTWRRGLTAMFSVGTEGLATFQYLTSGIT